MVNWLTPATLAINSTRNCPDTKAKMDVNGADDDKKLQDTAKKMQEQLRDITECCICTEVYKDPRILPCIHSFCKNCLETAGSKSNKKPGEKMPCPLCRKEFIVPSEGFNGIQKNFFMVSLMEMTNSLSPSPASILCDACLEDNDPATATGVPQAELFCQDCCLKLCESCCRHHRKSKLTKGHDLVPVGAQSLGLQNQRKSVPDVCDKHERETLKIHCSDCKKVVCPFCYIEGHQGHKYSDVNKAADEFRNQIQTDIQNLKVRNSDLQRKIAELDQLKLTILQKAERLESTINLRRFELKKIVDRDSDALILELTLLKNGKTKEVETEKDYMGTQLALLDSYEMYTNEMITKGAASDILRGVDDLKARAVELEQLSESTIQRKNPSFEMSVNKTPVEEYLKTVAGCNIVGKLKEGGKTG